MGEPVELSAAWAAAASSPAVANRSRGSFANPRAITQSRWAGMPGRISDARGGVAVRCAYMRAARLSARKGAPPVRSLCKTQASA